MAGKDDRPAWAKLDSDKEPDLEVVIDGPEPEEGKIDTERGLGERAEIERAPTQAFQTGDVPTKGRPVSGPRQIPSVHPTEQFFLTGRVQADTFLGLGAVPPPVPSDELPETLEEARAVVTASQPPPKLADETLAQKHAKLALLRTLNFLDYLIVNSPASARASLEERKSNLMMPCHLPEDEEIRRFEYYTQSFGWYGPVLWFIPPGITLDDLVAADLLSEDWWRAEPNFNAGLPTLSPFNPPPFEPKAIDPNLEKPEYREPGYWVLAAPCLTPGTTGKIFNLDSYRLTDFVRMSGFDLKGDTIHPKHRMIMKVLRVTDVLVFCAIAQHAKELISRIPLIARTATVVRTHHEEVWDSRSCKNISVTAKSLHSKCRACVQFAPDEKLRITDWVDDAPSQVVGMIIFTIPHIY